jgi:hypothetical protein
MPLERKPVCDNSPARGLRLSAAVFEDGCNKVGYLVVLKLVTRIVVEMPDAKMTR